MRSGGKPRRRSAGGTVQTPSNLAPIAADGQPGTQLALGPMEEPAEVLVRFSTDEPEAAAEQVAAPPAREEAATDQPPAGETAAEQVAAPPAEALAKQVAAQPIEATEAASSEELPAYERDQPGPVDDASLLLRLARIHLRTGSLTTARAQLESLAGRNQLDTAGTLDLAEARWRTGDLQGAGDAAGAYLAANGGEALGLVIAAEAASLGIHEAEARGYMEQARLRTLTSFNAIFAGIPRRSKLTESERESIVGPEQIPVADSPRATEPVATATVVAEPEPQPKVEPEPQPKVEPAAEAEPQPKVEPEPQPKVEAEPQPKVEAEPVATLAAETVAEPEPAAEPEPVAKVEPEPVAKVEPEPVAKVEPEPVATATVVAEPEPAAEPEPTPTVPVAGVAGTPATGPSIADQATQPVLDSSRAQADTEIAAGIALLETGDALMAALHFGIALRMTPESAQAVLGAIGDRHDLALELVRGDALRMQGHERDAGQAYQSVASALSGARAAAEPPAKTPAGPAEAVAEPPAEAVAEPPAEAVAETPGEPPGLLLADAAADVPAAMESTEAPQEANSPEPRPPEPAPPIVWSD